MRYNTSYIHSIVGIYLADEMIACLMSSYETLLYSRITYVKRTAMTSVRTRVPGVCVQSE